MSISHYRAEDANKFVTLRPDQTPEWDDGRLGIRTWPDDVAVIFPDGQCWDRFGGRDAAGVSIDATPEGVVAGGSPCGLVLEDHLWRELEAAMAAWSSASLLSYELSGERHATPDHCWRKMEASNRERAAAAALWRTVDRYVAFHGGDEWYAPLTNMPLRGA